MQGEMSSLAEVSELCYRITQSYLGAPNVTTIITETQNAINVTRSIFIDDIFPRWSPLNGEISFSYNGGKDCQVLLLLYLGCLWEYFIINAHVSQYEGQYQRFPMDKLPTVFINMDDTFPTLETFIRDTSLRYHLSLYDSCRSSSEPGARSMAAEFERFLKVYPETEAIVIGIRHSDPWGETLRPLQRTDAGWPDFMRLQPILHWNLANVWSFLLYSNEPICGLYGHGFTSIGGIGSTVPNPHLKKKKEEDLGAQSFQFGWEMAHSYGNSTGSAGANTSELDSEDVQLFTQQEYYPGWYLVDDSLERAGRIARA